MARQRRTPPALLAVVIGMLALALVALALVVRDDAERPHRAGAAVVRML
jgi:hypothetical protein